mmetsp:Transcript_120941/g.347449  ORF Transcript_120941/g.347449 Transcript_120941/m.347449 type:complete len:267 (-) Transcript_120941:168-968(-)
MSSAGISVAKEDGVAIVTFAGEPVNAMSLAFWKELLATVEGLDADPEVRAMVFHSGLKKSVFTAGLDIRELYVPMTNHDRVYEFWATLSEALVKIYSTPKITAAAIKGACPAGGCVLSLCCDYRAITADGSMGLNEVILGIPVPHFWAQVFASVTGQRQAELLLQSGAMPKAPELLKIGMVDAVVETADEVLPAALKEVRKWLKYRDASRAMTKMSLRGPLAERWHQGIEWESDMVWQSLNEPEAIESLTKVLKMLAGGNAPAAKL